MIRWFAESRHVTMHSLYLLVLLAASRLMYFLLPLPAGGVWLSLRRLFIPSTFQDIALLAGACAAHTAANAVAEALVPGAASVGFGASLAPVILLHLVGAHNAATRLCATLAVRMAVWLPILNIVLDLIFSL